MKKYGKNMEKYVENEKYVRILRNMKKYVKNVKECEGNIYAENMKNSPYYIECRTWKSFEISPTT